MCAMNHRLLRPRASGRFLLDQFGGAAAAYSLRRLSSSYTGPAVQVRRSSDSAEETFTPEQISNGALASWVGSGNDGHVKTWYDQSGQGRHATQNTAASQPLIVSSGSLVSVSGRASIDFDTHFLVPNEAWGITGTSDRSFFAVYVPDDLTLNGSFYCGIGSGTSSGNGEAWSLTSEPAVRVDGGNEVYQAATVGALQIASHVFTGSLVEDNVCHINGTEQSVTSFGTKAINTVDTFCRIGVFVSTLNYFFNGRLSEIIIYSKNMASSRSSITDSQIGYY